MARVVVPRMSVSMAMVVVVVPGRLEDPAPPGDQESEDEHGGHADAVVAVELEFRQDVARGDAEERAGAEGEGERGEGHRVRREVRPREVEADPERDHQGEREVHQVHRESGPPGMPHERDDREGVERLVQHDAEEDREAGDAEPGRTVHLAVARRLVEARDPRPVRRPQREAGKQGVDGEADQRPHPVEPVRRRRRVLRTGDALAGTVVVAAGVALLVRRLVVVEAEEPLEEEHREKTADGGQHDVVDVRWARAGRGVQRHLGRVAEHVHQADPEHHARDQREGELHPSMRQAEEGGHEPPRHRDDRDDEAEEDERRGEVHDGSAGG